LVTIIILGEVIPEEYSPQHGPVGKCLKYHKTITEMTRKITRKDMVNIAFIHRSNYQVIFMRQRLLVPIPNGVRSY
jgi:hypothetical protein